MAIRAYRAKTIDAGGCQACRTRPRPEEVTVIEMTPEGSGTTTVLRLCDVCNNQMHDALHRANRAQVK